MIITPFTKPDRYIACPKCGKGEHMVSHLAAGTKTAWYCDERECGYRFRLHVLDDGKIEVQQLTEKKVPLLITLRSSEPVTLVVEGIDFRTKSDEPLASADDIRFFYEEHTCPTNYLGRVLQVRNDAGDDDPHGIFAYVKQEAWRDI